MDIFSINNISGFAEVMRDNAAKSLADHNGYETHFARLDNFITLQQTEDIISNKCKGVDTKGQCIIDADIFAEIFEEVRNTIYHSSLAKLAAAGAVECAWDDAKDKMVFWINNKYGEQVDLTEPPEYNIPEDGE